ncbi:MAG: hypothetical protein AB1671_05590 [Thermodesulfobacteriota bacterium]|jgi:hypothetical protein
MTKSMILRQLAEVAGKLAELRVALEQLPDPAVEHSLDSPAVQRRGESQTNRLQAGRFVDKHALQPLIARSFAEMGIRGEPVGAEKVQEMIAACGVREEDNILSRGIVDMREE